MAKIVIEIDTDTKSVTATVGGSLIEGLNYASVYKYSDYCEVRLEKVTKQDGMTISKTYSACASQSETLELKEDDKKKLESAAGYFKKVIK